MGGAPPPRLAAREHIPLPPTMQPYLHIFSHYRLPTALQTAENARRDGHFGDRARQPAPAPECKRAADRATCDARLQRCRRLRDVARGHTIACARAATPPTGPAIARPSRPPPPPTPHGALAAALAALALAPSSRSPAAAPPRTPAAPKPTRPRAVPASAPLYAGRDGAPERRAEAAARAGRGRGADAQADPYLRLLGALRTPGSPALDFARDVAPGSDRTPGSSSARSAPPARCSALLAAGSARRAPAGGAASRSAAGGAQGALVLDTSDAARRARSSPARPSARARTPPAIAASPTRSSSGGVAFGLVGRFAVIGSEAGAARVIDTDPGRRRARHAATATRSCSAAAPADALAHLYANPARRRGSSGAAAPARACSALLARRRARERLARALGELAGARHRHARRERGASAAGLLAADPEGGAGARRTAGRILARARARARRRQPRPATSRACRRSLAGRAPGRAPKRAGALSLRSLLGGLLDAAAILGADSAAGAARLPSWMGSAGVFASGVEPARTEGGGRDRLERPRALARRGGKLAAALRKRRRSKSATSRSPAPKPRSRRASPGCRWCSTSPPAAASDGQTKFVLGLGEASVQAALAPAEHARRRAALRSAAAAALGEGDQPSVIARLPDAAQPARRRRADRRPVASPASPLPARARRRSPAAATQLGGEVERFRLVLGLHQSG